MLVTILIFTAFLFGYICHAQVTKFLKKAEAKATAEAGALAASAQAEIEKKL